MTELQPTLSHRDGVLYRNGSEHRLLGGAIHYFRVHPCHWADRLDRLVALGANTLDTYIAWNVHQKRKNDEPDFSGPRDIVRFIRLAEERGLDVMIRPGPYICAEWDNGGLPAWLTSIPGIRLRSVDERFQAAVERWFDVLLPRLTPLQRAAGGPIVVFQAENEYGSYGDDPQYVAWTQQILQDRGVTELIFTADGGSDFFLDGGSANTMLATGTLGSRGRQAIDTWKRRRPGEPFIAAEFWNGWFDHWGEEHHRRDPAEAATEVRRILDGGGSVCLYMAHGGTNFGLGSGANHDGFLQPTVTSYDSDAPIAEDGRLTDKFWQIRAAFGGVRAQLGQKVPEIPAGTLQAAPTLPARTLTVQPRSGLMESLRKLPVTAVNTAPLSFDDLGCPNGMVLYRARPVLPSGEFSLRLEGLHDRALVFRDGELLTIFEAEAHDPLVLQGAGQPATVEILVENQGRINYGHLLGQGKGILGGMLINQRMTYGWEHIALPLDDYDAEQLQQLSGEEPHSYPRTASGAGFSEVRFDLTEPADSHLRLPGFRKGFLWINGEMLGRYWDKGPQQTLYAPQGMFRSGTNLMTILELERSGEVLEFHETPQLG